MIVRLTRAGLRPARAALFLSVIVAGIALLPIRTEAQGDAYDIVIRGGRVVDGTGNPWFRADVAVKDGRIAAIGNLKTASARRTIDASGLVVAPGFIDPHSHSDYTLLADGNAESMVRDGVTLNAIGESNSVGPRDGLKPQTMDGVTVNWTHFGEYFAKVRQKGISLNLIAFASGDQVRRAARGDAAGPATPAELARMEALMARSMEEGAWGLVTGFPAGGPAYPEETIALAKVAARYGGLYNTHMGGEGGQSAKEIAFAVRVAEEADIPVEIYHLKILGKHNWGKVGASIVQIEAARARGLDITANQYPYTAMYHRWAPAFIPAWVREGGDAAFVARLRDPATRAKIKAGADFPELVEESGGWDGIILAQTYTEANKPYLGKSIAEIAKLRGDSDPADSAMTIMADDGGQTRGVFSLDRHFSRRPGLKRGRAGRTVSERGRGYSAITFGTRKSLRWKMPCEN